MQNFQLFLIEVIEVSDIIFARICSFMMAVIEPLNLRGEWTVLKLFNTFPLFFLLDELFFCPLKFHALRVKPSMIYKLLLAWCVELLHTVDLISAGVLKLVGYFVLLCLKFKMVHEFVNQNWIRFPIVGLGLFDKIQSVVFWLLRRAGNLLC